jgi:beta-glucosidase
MNTDIQSIIASMTLEEKAALCTGASAWSTTPVERLGVPEMIVADGPHGVRRVPDIQSMALRSLPPVSLPHPVSAPLGTWI